MLILFEVKSVKYVIIDRLRGRLVDCWRWRGWFIDCWLEVDQLIAEQKRKVLVSRELIKNFVLIMNHWLHLLPRKFKIMVLKNENIHNVRIAVIFFWAKLICHFFKKTVFYSPTSDVVSPAAYILFFSAVEDRNSLHPLGEFRLSVSRMVADTFLIRSRLPLQ